MRPRRQPKAHKNCPKINQQSTLEEPRGHFWRSPGATLGSRKRRPGRILGPRRLQNTVCLDTRRLTHFSRHCPVGPGARFGHHFGSFLVMILMNFRLLFLKHVLTSVFITFLHAFQPFSNRFVLQCCIAVKSDLLAGEYQKTPIFLHENMEK